MNSPLTRRSFTQLTSLATASLLARNTYAQNATTIFDGKTLQGWQQIENNATSLASTSIKDPATFATWLTDGSDAMSVYLRTRLPEPLKKDLTDWSPTAPNAKTVLAALVKEINQIISGPSLYDKDRLTGIVLRKETAELIVQNPEGVHRARMNKLLLEDAYPEELIQSTTTGWTVKEGAMASTGSGRGVIYTANDYTRFRLGVTMRHISGDPDHQACILIFCTRPNDNELPLDALGGIQFQAPNGGHWDYRPGKNTAGAAQFTTITKTQFDPHAWSRVEITADATTGTARMSVAQPPDNKPVDVLDFKDPTAGKPGPIAWQMHNAGLFDEYKDVVISAL